MMETFPQKLMLITLLGFAMGASQIMLNFEVIDEESHGNDLHPDDLSMNVAGYARLLRLLGRRASNTLESMIDRPRAYHIATNLTRNRKGPSSYMFNQVDSKTEAHGVSLSAAASLPKFNPKPRTTCAYRRYLLRWFPIYSYRTLAHVCFIPWAWLQKIYYVKCTHPNCKSNTFGTGRCRLTGYCRRRILVYCYKVCKKRWSWRWVPRNVPQKCRCSDC